MANSKRLVREISISNLGVIESATLDLGSGFNVLTGETGAGKTMILTALGLLAGEKADADFVRAGSEKLSVSAIVHSESVDYDSLAELISEHEPDIDDGEIVLARSVSRDGKNRAMVGGVTTTAGIVAKFANEFYSIHGQGTNQKLLSNSFQKKLVDLSDETLNTTSARFRAAVLDLKERLRQIVQLRQSLRDSETTRQKLITFQNDLKKISLKAGELEDINLRIERLDSIEEWLSALSGAFTCLDDEDRGAVASISQAIRSLNPLSKGSEAMKILGERLESAKDDLADLRNEIATLLGDLEGEPGDLDKLRERKASILAFVKKNSHLVDIQPSEEEMISALMEYGVSVEVLLANLGGGNERLNELEAEKTKVFGDLIERARELSAARKSVAQRIETSVLQELEGLGLGGSEFSIDFTESVVSEPESLSPDGLDEMVFKFASHANIEPLPLTKGISGGELSRLMLAIELALVSNRNQSSIVFDEVDSGIGGETANIVGERLRKLSENHQIIVVTHLPQVAVWADHHFVITKSSQQEIVQSSVRKVNGEDRVREIARMLSGELENEAALLHARSLLEHAISE